jgi:glycosyltransferase involved in cell wall biosynthesis
VARFKVAVVSDAIYPWHKGGKETRYRHLFEQLPRLDVDVEVFTMRWWSVPPPHEEGEAGSLTYTAICPLKSLYRGKRRSIVQSVWFAGSTLRLLTKRFDIVEADHMPFLQLLPLRLVTWIRRVPFVVTWHEYWGRDGWRTYLGRLGFIGAVVERVSARLPDEIMTVSEGTAAKLRAAGVRSERVHIVANAIDLNELTTIDPHPTAPDLLFVGRLLRHKNAHLAIGAASILRQRGFDVRLGVVGVGPEEETLRELAHDLGMDDHVVFFGSIPSQREVWSLMRGARVLLAPSVREGYGLVVAEALSLGTPVVCVEHPENESTRLVRSDIGSVAQSESLEDIASAAELWLQHEGDRLVRAKTFLEHSPEISPRAMAQSYVSTLQYSIGRYAPRTLLKRHS